MILSYLVATSAFVKGFAIGAGVAFAAKNYCGGKMGRRS